MPVVLRSKPFLRNRWAHISEGASPGSSGGFVPRPGPGLNAGQFCGRTNSHPTRTYSRSRDEAEEAITIAGSEGGAVSFGACCLPVPGDGIMAFVSTDKGVVVHRVRCSNVREFLKHPDRCINVQWAPITTGMFPVAVRIVARNTPGVLASISTSIGEAGSNIETVAQPEANPETATLLFNLSVKDRDHMARVMRRLRRNNKVIRVNRIG